MKYLLAYLSILVAFLSLGQDNTVLNLESSLIFKSNPINFNHPSNILGANPNYSPSEIDINSPLDGSSTLDSRFNNNKNWTLNKKEFRIGFGFTQFLGDLGGRDAYGTDYSLKDWNNQAISYMGMLGYRFRLSKSFATTTSLNFGLLRGDDAFIDSTGGGGKFRLARNLNFRSPFIDISQRIDFMLYTYEKIGKRYNIRGIKGFNNRNEQIYVFAGLGAIGYMPQGQLNGRWYNLRRLSTEGQGLVGGTAKYSPVVFVAPFGFGFRVGISREWRFGMETSYTKVFGDYIDDVAGVYYDKGLLESQKGEIAAALSDKSDASVAQGYAAGMQRGDKQNDSYYFLNVVISRNITYRNYTKTYKRYKLSKSRYKF